MATITRRAVLHTTALATTLLAAPFVRGANEPLERLCRTWAEREKVDLKLDFITSNGDKDLLTVAAEAQAKTGHDIQSFTAWYAPGQAENLEPVDDVMTALVEYPTLVCAVAASL